MTRSRLYSHTEAQCHIIGTLRTDPNFISDRDAIEKILKGHTSCTLLTVDPTDPAKIKVYNKTPDTIEERTIEVDEMGKMRIYAQHEAKADDINAYIFNTTAHAKKAALEKNKFKVIQQDSCLDYITMAYQTLAHPLHRKISFILHIDRRGAVKPYLQDGNETVFLDAKTAIQKLKGLGLAEYFTLQILPLLETNELSTAIKAKL